MFAFGGVDVNDTPLDTRGEHRPRRPPDQRDGAGHAAVGMTREPTRMSAARVGHTASAVSTPGMAATPTAPDGAGPDAGAGVRRRRRPAAPSPICSIPPTRRSCRWRIWRQPAPGASCTPPSTSPSATRRRLLLLGGQADDGSPRGDSILYDPITQHLLRRAAHAAHAPLRLHRVRHRQRPGGGRRASAPTASAWPPPRSTTPRRFAFVSELKAEARSGATATPLPNLTMMLLGGTDTDDGGDLARRPSRSTSPAG